MEAVREDETFTITDLAAEFGVTPRAIRFYEGEGLIEPARQGQNRVYSRRDRARLAWILRGKNVGFSLAEIKEILDLYDAGDGRVRQRERTLELCRRQIGVLTNQRNDIDATLAELQEFVAVVEGLLPSNAKSGES
jgi:DNA-binding transcriptional MerR regulator